MVGESKSPGISPYELKQLLKSVFGLVVIYIINTHDQPIIVQIKGNRTQSTMNSSEVGASFTVSANKADFRTLTAEQSGVLPYIYVEISCSTAPSYGQVDIYLVRGIYNEEKLVDALKIRDTNIHTPDTDPDKIFIKRWWL